MADAENRATDFSWYPLSAVYIGKRQGREWSAIAYTPRLTAEDLLLGGGDADQVRASLEQWQSFWGLDFLEPEKMKVEEGGVPKITFRASRTTLPLLTINATGRLRAFDVVDLQCSELSYAAYKALGHYAAYLSVPDYDEEHNLQHVGAALNTLNLADRSFVATLSASQFAQVPLENFQFEIPESDILRDMMQLVHMGPTMRGLFACNNIKRRLRGQPLRQPAGFLAGVPTHMLPSRTRA